jgi:hypothetical protein
MIIMHFESPILVCGSLLPCIGAFVQMLRSKQFNRPDALKGHYESPLVPYLPCFGIYVNLLLSWEPSWWVQGQLLVFTVMGLVIYFAYGLHNSILNYKD